MAVEIRELAPGDFEAVWDLERVAFAAKEADRERSEALFRPQDTLGAWVDGRLGAMVEVIDGGQFFGGSRVPMGGVAGVATAPEQRGRGLAAQVVSAALERMARSEHAVSTLYGAAGRLYRGLGYGVAGVQVGRRLHARALRELPSGEPRVTRRAGRVDQPAIEACYSRLAPARDGWVDRPAHRWHRLLGSRWAERQAYAIDGVEGLEGYVLLSQAAAEFPSYRIHVEELMAADAHAERALWRLAGSAASALVRDVSWFGPAEHPLLLLLDEQELRTTYEERWLLRVVDLPRAMAARGFRAGVSAVADIEVVDPQLPAKAGPWRLEVADRGGRAERGSAPRLRLGASALASLWSGYATASSLARLGLVQATGAGAGEALEALDSMFTGPTPSIGEFF